VKIRASSTQESKWRQAARISGTSLDEWAGMHLDICAGLALASVEFCELCGQNAVDPCETQRVFVLPEPGDDTEGTENKSDAVS
jgi:hypothetical protein